MKKWFKRLFVGLLVVFVGMQLVPVNRDNPPVHAKQTLSAPPEVMAILRTSCYDCHSNETRWPWYTYVAPVSWWIVGHVHDGRRRLNFSEWSTLKPGPGGSLSDFGPSSPTIAQYQAKVLGRMEDDIMEGRMPLPSYLVIHADARITPGQNKILADWCNATIQQLNTQPSPGPSAQK